MKPRNPVPVSGPGRWIAIAFVGGILTMLAIPLLTTTIVLMIVVFHFLGAFLTSLPEIWAGASPPALASVLSGAVLILALSTVARLVPVLEDGPHIGYSLVLGLSVVGLVILVPAVLLTSGLVGAGVGAFLGCALVMVLDLEPPGPSRGPVPNPARPPAPARLSRVGALEHRIGDCPVCGDTLLGAVRLCGACHTPHHHDCWNYLDRCSTFACDGKPVRRRFTPVLRAAA